MVRSNQPPQPEMDISNTQFAERSRQLMGIMSKLRAFGAQTVIDLPRIAVIGGQSAGKSSLVEAVSGLRVPRDSGTCTRCPMECTMYTSNNAEGWSCQIKLRFDYNNLDQSLPQTREEKFGPIINDKADVELRLRQAQAAILNPFIPSDVFLLKSCKELEDYKPDAAASHGTCKFSRNTVVVDIYDPDSANLSFIDLPGLIQNEDDETVNLVQSLVTSNIQGNCLILVTIPMTDDMENQRAKRLAQEVDPEHVRTIGVLTKPDMLTSGATNARERWTRVMKGQDHKLKHGYYCVRLADDTERLDDLSRADMQAISEQFFRTTAPWDTFVDSGKFGVPALVTNLSRHLTEIIDQSLPKIRDEVQLKIDECKESLSELPAPVKPEASEIIMLLTTFCKDLSDMVYGSGHSQESKSFIQENRSTYKLFKRNIRETAPDFKPFIVSDMHMSIEDFTEDGELDPLNFTCDPRALTLNLLDVREVIKKSIAWELPNNVPYDSKSKLIKDTVDLWDDHVLSCYYTVAQRLNDALLMRVQRYFGRFPYLRTYFWTLISAQLEVAKLAALRDVQMTLKLEKNPFFTQNSFYLESIRNSWLDRYKDARRDPDRYQQVSLPERVRASSPEPEHLEWSTPNPPLQNPDVKSPRKSKASIAHKKKKVYHNSSKAALSTSNPDSYYLDQALEALRQLGYNGVTAEQLGRLKTPIADEYEEEIIVMADVRAYFQVAYKRIIDSVPLTIEHSLNQHLADTLQSSLIEKLDFSSPDAKHRWAQLLAEDPAVAAKRDELHGKLKKLEHVQLELRAFGI